MTYNLNLSYLPALSTNRKISKPFRSHFHPWKFETDNVISNAINVSCLKTALGSFRMHMTKNEPKQEKYWFKTLESWKNEAEFNHDLASPLSSESCFSFFSYSLHSAWTLSPNGSLNVAARWPQHPYSQVYWKIVSIFYQELREWKYSHWPDLDHIPTHGDMGIRILVLFWPYGLAELLWKDD